MSKTKENIVKFLKGEFLLNEDAFKNWRMVIFIILLLLMMVRSGHITDEKVMHISKLSKQERELRAEYIAVRSKAMKLKLESNLKEKVKDMGLKSSNEPANVIRVIENDQ
ncbi:MAG TPA: S-adenosyl-methyltransferase [Lutibacter sp.]|nr:S-adenosyl-methyltransferase [Lutibacter sp.]